MIQCRASRLAGFELLEAIAVLEQEKNMLGLLSPALTTSREANETELRHRIDIYLTLIREREGLAVGKTTDQEQRRKKCGGRELAWRKWQL